MISLVNLSFYILVIVSLKWDCWIKGKRHGSSLAVQWVKDPALSSQQLGPLLLQGFTIPCPGNFTCYRCHQKKSLGGSICYFAGYHQISVIEIEPFYIPAIKCIKQYFSYSLTNSICWKLLELYQCNCWKKKLNSNHLFGQWLFIPYPHSMNRYAFIKVTPLEFYALVFALQFVFFLIEKKQQNAYFLIFFK